MTLKTSIAIEWQNVDSNNEVVKVYSVVTHFIISYYPLQKNIVHVPDYFLHPV